MCGCRKLVESHSHEICFWSAISPASETRKKFFLLPERPKDGVEKAAVSHRDCSGELDEFGVSS